MSRGTGTRPKRVQNRRLTQQEMTALVNDSESEDEDFHELYTPEEIAEATSEEIAEENTNATENTNENTAESENEDDFDFQLESEDEDRIIPREVESDNKGVNSMAAALEEKHYTKYKMPTVIKKYTVKVKPEIRPQQNVKWVNRPPQQATGRQGAHMIIHTAPGLITAAAKAAITHLKAWELFFDSEIIQKIVNYTNMDIREVRSRVPQSTLDDKKITHFNETDAIEIRAIIGLSYFRGQLNQNLAKIQQLFDEDIGHPVFGATMSAKRFGFLLARIRFDDKATRPERYQIDRLAAIREIFEMFNCNCSKHVAPTVHSAVDECLYPMRNKSDLKNYNPDKPAKYGLLIQSYNSVDFPFTHSMIVSTGKPKSGDGPYYIPKVFEKVRKLVENTERYVKLQGRNISMDRYYTSIQLAEWLLDKKKITMLGTLQKNRQGLPKQVVSLDGRETHSYEVFWEEERGIMELHSYAVINKSKGKKNVMLLSTNQPIKGITKGHKKKLPGAIQLYNYTKGRH